MLETKILEDYKNALKQKDALRSSVLSFLRAELLNVAVSKKKNSLEDAEVIATIRKQIKARQDSIDQFEKGNRPELAAKERKEMEILKGYLPPEMSVEDIKALIDKAIAATGAQGIRDMGKVMKEVAAATQGNADPKTVSDLVKARLIPAA